jgi:hypothetical protein
MKVWLDDERSPPDDSWTVAKTFPEFVTLWTFHKHKITHIGFDHDLGSLDHRETGYAAVCMVEEDVFNNVVSPPVMTCQSDNGPGRRQIDLAIRAMYRYEMLAS